MEFKVTLKNRLTDTKLSFEEEFDLYDIFPEEKHIFDLLIENLDIYNPEDYETVEDIITDCDEELEKFIKITNIKGFNFDLDFSDANINDINELFNLEVDMDKLEAYAEFDGFMDVYKIIHEKWDDIYLYKDIDTFDELGYYYINSILGDISELSREQLERYFDYEAFGRDLDMDTTGAFTHNGYLDANNYR
jgi:hypothetical protein